MLKSKSVLTTIRPNLTQNRKLNLEIWDPENNEVSTFLDENLSEFEKIANALNLIKQNIKNNDKAESLYNHWLERGWNKSIEYYLASRANSSKIVKQEEIKRLTQTINSVDKDNKNEKKYTIPQALLNRRSKRVFNKQPITQEILFSGIENFMQTINIINGFQLYFIIYNVDKIKPSVNFYNSTEKTLSLIREGNFSEDMSRNIQGLRSPKTAAFTIILVADFIKLAEAMPYPRGLRDVYIEAGRLAQHILISYMQFEIFSLVTPALCDRPVAKLLKLEEDNLSPLYSITLGSII